MKKRIKYKIHYLVDKALPIVVIILGIIIILENPFWILVHLEDYQPWIGMLDSIIVGVLILDLYFKWLHVKTIKKFVKYYWLDLIAVFPFYLIFRAGVFITELIRVGEEIKEAQQITHEAILLREIKAAEKETRIVRETRIIPRTIRTVQRFLRLMSGGIKKHK
ncbi:hypothetical protein HYV79_01220 [Candidatus Woesearchaeota archaeon]|nr:hypothetical protein [Candidatus Woesearchaeota archaeon]